MSRLLAIFALLPLLVVTGCQTSADSPEAPPAPADLRRELEAAASAWHDAGLEDYAMRVRYRHPGWHVQVLDVRVESGVPAVTSHGCVPRRSCSTYDVEAARLTVDNIFQEAQNTAATIPVEHLVIHNKYGFPGIVAFSGDSADSWEISNFRPLK
jgi:hypothetical protein